MDRFVVGFAFNLIKSKILLVEKRRPEWQKGLLNGVGGKIERGESPLEAMNRETLEETGLVLPWIYRGKMVGRNNDGNFFECHIFYAYTNKILQYKQIEDEPLGIYRPLSLREFPVIRNLLFLVPYGMFDDGSKFITLQYG